jgi:hypothetical protein
MIAALVTGQPPLHYRAEGGRGLGLRHEVEVIRHDAETKPREGELLLGDREQVTEGMVVGVLVEDGRQPVTSVEDMIDVPGDLTTRDARHSGDGTARWNGRARKSSLSTFSAPAAGSQVVAIDDGTATSKTISNLSAGTYYFVVAATDVSGNESEMSDEVSKTIQ